MFATALVGFLAAMPTEGAGALVVLLLAVPIILFWKRLAAGFSKLFFDKTEGEGQRIMPPLKLVVALPAAQTPAVTDLDTDRIRQAAMFEPARVVEGTTKTLEERTARI
jgi:hypothetical protein